MVIQIGKFKRNDSLLTFLYDRIDRSYRNFVLEIVNIRFLQSLDGILYVVSDYQHSVLISFCVIDSTVYDAFKRTGLFTVPFFRICN